MSVVVVVFNMAREAPRTLRSLSASYQRHIRADDYEVIVVDNGSQPPLDPAVLRGLDGDFRLIRIDDASPSPVKAVNRGLAAARGEVIGVMIDGARIATPGLLHFARHAAQLYPQPVVATLGWYLGFDFQRWSMLAGHDAAREDALLRSIAWPADGYRLFEIGTMDESSIDGWLQPIPESNALFLRREAWRALGGLDERFDAPGGGLVNLDTFSRAMALPGARRVVLLGEGTFHQVHGGVATNLHPERMGPTFTGWLDQYRSIRGAANPPLPVQDGTTFVGTLPQAALSRFVRAAIDPRPHAAPPLGAGFDRSLWRPVQAGSDGQGVIADLVRLAQEEFRAGRYAAAAGVARLARAHAPEEPEPQRLLVLSSPWLAINEELKPEHAVDYHAALGDACRMLADSETAQAHYRAALAAEVNTPRAHIGLALLRMPGDDYYVWLKRLYRALQPDSVLEIGVNHGESLACVFPPALAIGVDPSPRLEFQIQAEAHIYPETSDMFFARQRLERLLPGKVLDVAFIDGLHSFEQVLRDVINVEAWCGPRSVVVLHDTVPLDEMTQLRERRTGFWTGDVWKAVLCLKHYRPELDVFTVAAPPTGLTVITGLDPRSTVLTQRYAEAVTAFMDMQFAAIEPRLHEALNIVPNDWETVASRLRVRGVLPASAAAAL